VQPEDQRVVDDFVDLARKEGFDPLWTRAFLDSMEADLHRAAYDTLEDTLGYIYGSAEVIGLFMSRLMGLPAESFQAARLLGRAMQYINFIRDVAEDRTLGRRYLPLNGFDPRVVEPEWAQGHAAQFSDWLRSHLGLYRQWQEEALAGFPFIPYRYRIAVAAAADMYWWTAATIERNPLVVFEKKVKPRRFRIYSAILRNAMMGAVFTPRRA
jgi:phytoene synthase